MNRSLLVGFLFGCALTSGIFLLFRGEASQGGGAVLSNERLLASVDLLSGPSAMPVIVVQKEKAPLRSAMQKQDPTPPVAQVAAEPAVVVVEPVSAAVPCSYQSNSSALGGVILSEVAWMGTVQGPNYEWFEIRNVSPAVADLSLWQIVDLKEQIHITIPNGTILAPGAFLVFERDEAALPATVQAMVYTGALSNESEGLRLFTKDCLLQDEAVASPAWPAGTNDPKYSMERKADGSWQTYYGPAEDGIFGTPGKVSSAGRPPETDSASQATSLAPVSPPAPEQAATPTTTPSAAAEPTPVVVPPGALFLSEVMVGTEANSNDEFIELWNTASFEIDLTGYSIKKKTSSGSESTLVSATRLEGKKILAGSRFVIGREGQFSGTGQATWASSNSLAYENNSVALYSSTGEKINEVSWVEIIKGQSLACVSASSCSAQVTPNPGS